MVDITRWASGKQATRRLYLKNPYLREIDSILIDYVRDKGRRYYIVLDQTIFHPRGGGQPDDQGLIRGEDFVFEVRKVLNVKDVIVHYGRVVQGELSEKGSRVWALIDWERRYNVMRLHTAGHILDYAVKQVYGRILNTLDAFHGPPKPYIVYEGPLPTREMLREIERIANEVVEAGKPVKTIYVRRDELNEYVFNAPNLERLPPADTYRIVVIEDVNAIPCTGTHVKNTREVKHIIVEDVEEASNGFKLYYNVE